MSVAQPATPFSARKLQVFHAEQWVPKPKKIVLHVTFNAIVQKNMFQVYGWEEPVRIFPS
jgi:hypothetical protein